MNLSTSTSDLHLNVQAGISGKTRLAKYATPETAPNPTSHYWIKPDHWSPKQSYATACYLANEGRSIHRPARPRNAIHSRWGCLLGNIPRTANHLRTTQHQEKNDDTNSRRTQATTPADSRRCEEDTAKQTEPSRDSEDCRAVSGDDCDCPNDMPGIGDHPADKRINSGSNFAGRLLILFWRSRSRSVTYRR